MKWSYRQSIYPKVYIHRSAFNIKMQIIRIYSIFCFILDVAKLLTCSFTTIYIDLSKGRERERAREPNTESEWRACVCTLHTTGKTKKVSTRINNQRVTKFVAPRILFMCSALWRVVLRSLHWRCFCFCCWFCCWWYIFFSQFHFLRS